MVTSILKWWLQSDIFWQALLSICCCCVSVKTAREQARPGLEHLYPVGEPRTLPLHYRAILPGFEHIAVTSFVSMKTAKALLSWGSNINLPCVSWELYHWAIHACNMYICSSSSSRDGLIGPLPLKIKKKKINNVISIIPWYKHNLPLFI